MVSRTEIVSLEAEHGPLRCIYLLMQSKRPDPFSFPGLSPDGKSEWDFHLDSKKVEFVKRVSTGAVHELSKNVQFVMREINALVFQGIRTDGHQEGLCYMGWPHRRFGTEGNELPVKDEDCFLVFINEERIIYNWRWESIPAKSLETFVPVRFTGRIR